MRLPTRAAIAGLAAVSVFAITTAGGPASAAAPYQQDDYAKGNLLNILPPGENGLYNAADAANYETTKSRPAATTDQFVKYENLLYGSPTLTDSTLGDFFHDGSFGVPAGELTRTEIPSTAVPVTIYRDKADVPHIYGKTDNATEFGAGYAGAEDRLFIMDVLRHYGQGTLSSFLGPSCSDEAMDHDQLLLTGYSNAELQAQFDSLSRYGPQGVRFKELFTNFLAGINQYVSDANLNPALLPADYVAAAAPPQKWTIKDIIGIAGLVGGIFGKGGGNELANASLIQYLDKTIGAAQAASTFSAFRSKNDPTAPTTILDKAFPYDIPGKLDPKTRALPDPGAPITGGPTRTTANCNLTKPNVTALTVIDSVLKFPAAMSNALLIDAKHSASGHPVTVFGPQVGYFTPQILMEEELHGPDLVAEGASFVGTNGIVELGRGEDYAWSATSAGTDNVDTRLERLCNPSGGAVAAESKYYLFKGKCNAMRTHTFTETAVPKAGGMGAPVVINHTLYYTIHGPVQGWTRSGGKPVAITSQRSTYGKELDSGLGFLAFNSPSLTHDATSWMKAASEISYTFNWLYADDRDIAYYVSGADPIRAKNYDPSFPTWGDGTEEWQGYLSYAAHPHEINPPQGFFTSWNNKPAPGFSAADDQYSYGPIYRSLSLDTAIRAQFAQHRNKLTRANLVQAMESAGTVDLTGARVLPELIPYLSKVKLDPTSKAMVATLQSWLSDGAHRIRAKHGDAQYLHASAVAIMDELNPRLIQAIYDPLFKAGGVSTTDGLTWQYDIVPQRFADTPNARGSRLGSAYDGGFEGFMLTVLRQLRGVKVADPFPSAVTTRICGAGGVTACPAAIAEAFAATAAAMTAANGGSSDVASWTANTETVAQKTTVPNYDGIAFAAVGLVPQDLMDWVNRPTFQQVVMFPLHRKR